MLAYEAEEKDYDAPEQPQWRQVSSALADEADKEEAGCSGTSVQAEKEAEYHHTPQKEEAAGCSGAPAQAEKGAECRHAPEKEAECPDHSPEEEVEEEAECPYSPEPSSSEA